MDLLESASETKVPSFTPLVEALQVKIGEDVLVDLVLNLEEGIN